MIDIVGISPFLRIPFTYAMETMHFHIAQTNLFVRTTLFRILGPPINNLAPMRNCHGDERYVKLVAGVIIMAFYHRIKKLFFTKGNNSNKTEILESVLLIGYR